MASLRKKYSTHIDAGPRQDEPPVTSPPEITAAELPPAVEPKPIEQPETESPAEKAAQNELRKRLEEMERAESLHRQQPQQPQRAAEPQAPQEPTLEQAIAGLPERIKRWYRQHPELATDPEKAAQVQYCHHVARRETGEEMTEPYFDRMEVMLGIAPATNGHTETKPTPQPTNDASARHSVPPRPTNVVRPSAAPVSAPPTRQVPSMSTGRAPNYRAPLSQDEIQIAQASGISPEEYQRNKERMLKMKAAGELNQ